MQPTLPTIAIHTPMQGGTFAGFFQIDGQAHGLILSPKAGDLACAPWRKAASDITGATSYCDGLANTIAMAAAKCPHALAVAKLDIAGFTDWYLPARDELELLYRHFKPTADTNYVWRSGDNPSSLPPGYPYTEALPAQTPALAFQDGGGDALEPTWYWSSTQCSRTVAWDQNFGNFGNQGLSDKSFEGRARAVRRFKVQ